MDNTIKPDPKSVNNIPANNNPASAAVTQETKSYAPESAGQNASPHASMKEITSFPKKNNLKKIIILLVVLVVLGGLVLGVLLYYKLRKTPSQDVKGEIVWWGIQHSQEVYRPLIENYQAQHPEIKIRYEQKSSSDYRELLAGHIGQGTAPDIFEIHNSWPVMFKNDLSVIPSEVMSTTDFKNSFYPVMSVDFLTQKGVVAIPLEYDAITLFINEDIFTSAVKSPPKTWDELRTLADPKEEGGLTIKDKSNKILLSGVALGETENVDYWPDILALMMYQNKVKPANPTGSEMTDVIGFFNLFRQKGVWNDTMPRSTTAFAQGTLAMYFAPTSRTSEIVRTNGALKFRTVPLPQLPKLNDTDPSYSYATYWANAVWQGSKDKSEAWDLLKYMSQPDTLIEINKNIKRIESVERLYPRPEMNIAFKDHEILASIASLAQQAKSWYLADNTFDGENGLNSKLRAAYAEGLKSKGGTKDLTRLADKVKGVLSSFSAPAR